MSTAQQQPEIAQAPGRSRKWLFRLTAVLLGLSPLLMFEGLCIAMGWGRASLHDDPFVGFRSVAPLFVKNDDGTRYEIAQARRAFFRPESFPLEKEPGEYRVFCLGGSTVQGRPFAIETAFSSWLEISLQAAEPARRFDVINCGGVSYASYRLVPILEEVLHYQPDLIILCTGQNEFLEDRSFEHIKNRGPLVDASLRAAARLRTFTLLREGYLHLRGTSLRDPPEGRPILPTEVEALLDYQGGLETYHRDEAWRRGVIAHFRYNVRRMIELARAAGVPMILVSPPVNLGDCPPFKSEHRSDLTAAELAEWESLCTSAHEHARRGNLDLQEAIRLFEQACRLDPLDAGGFYNLAGCYLAAGQIEQAREAFVQAKELDVCPLRMLEEMRAALVEIAGETGTPLIDAQELFRARSQDGIVGSQWLVDHVHPSIEGHQLLADTLADELVAAGRVHPVSDWQATKQARYRQHFDALDNHYFLVGQERLKGLRQWAAGRAQRLRPGREEESHTER